MAASIKVSELQSLTQLSDVDLFLVTDTESSTSRRVAYSDLKVNLTNNLLTAIADLTGTVSENNSSVNGRIDSEVATLVSLINTKISEVIDFAPDNLNSLNELAEAIGDDADFLTTLKSRLDTLEGTYATSAALSDVETNLNALISSLQLDVDQNEADADAAIASIQADVNQNAAVITAVQADVNQNAAVIAAVQADVNQNEADADAALAELQTKIDNLEIDIAPETLNSINELASALGGNPDIITNLQLQLNDYIEHIEARNLEAGLATGVIYADTIYGG